MTDKKDSNAGAQTAAATATATATDETIFVFIVVIPNYWGKGKSPQNAILNLQQITGKKPDLKKAVIYSIQCLQSQYDKVFISEYAEICYPKDAIKHCFRFEK